MLLQPKTKSQLLSYLCDISSNYSTNSTFSTNLNLLLSSLIMKTPQTGFFNDTQGLVPNRVYGLALCRGDISSEDCADCLQTAPTDVPNLCPYNKGSTVWYDSCLVRYENYDFFSVFNISQGDIYYFLTNVSDPVQFKDRLVMMIESISKLAAFNASNRYFSTGLTNVSGDEEIYGMVQCTRDLSSEQCFNCLNDSLSNILSCCYGLEGVMSLKASCVLRYDSDKFFNSNPAWVAPPSLGPGLGPPSQAPQLINFTKKGKNRIYEFLLRIDSVVSWILHIYLKVPIVQLIPVNLIYYSSFFQFLFFYFVGKSKKTVPIALGIGIPLVLSSALAIFLLICLQRRKRSRNRISKLHLSSIYLNHKPLVMYFKLCISHSSTL